MQVLEQSGTVDDVSKTAGADHVVADQSEVAAFLATPATHGVGTIQAQQLVALALRGLSLPFN